jgi:hypothetical protein
LILFPVFLRPEAELRPQSLAMELIDKTSKTALRLREISPADRFIGNLGEVFQLLHGLPRRGRNSRIRRGRL